MNGNSTTPIDAVNTSSTATLLSLKKRSTRYLSRCTEIAQSTGPDSAKGSQDIGMAIAFCSSLRAKRSNPGAGTPTPGLLRRGACHRAGHFGPDPLAPRNDDEELLTLL